MNNRAVTTYRFFGQQTTVSVFIKADVKKIWYHLINIDDYSGWNKTIISIQGNVKLGSTIILTTTLSPKYKFKLKVKQIIDNKLLIWGNSMGERQFLLQPYNDGTIFTMTENIVGLFYPLFSRMIPSLDQSFDLFAECLRQTSEKP